MNINIPVPTEAPWTIDPDTGAINWSREWYRFFTAIRQAVFGDTNGVDDEILARVGPDGIVGQLVLDLASAVLQANALASQALGMVTGLPQRIASLESQIQGRGEIPYRRIDDLEMLASRL